jgi:type III secretion protein V
VAAAPKSVDRERKLRMDALAQRIGIRDDSDVNFVLPVEIEVADDVRPLVETQRELVEQLIESIREESRYTVGVPIPPVRFRSNPGRLLGTYSIRIHERPVEVGRAYPEHRWCRQSASALAPLALQPIETLDPRTGAYACWLSAADAVKAESAGFRVDDPNTYMIDHTAVTLWNHAHLMTTVDTVASLLSPTLLAAMRAAPGGLVRFTAVILALLQERVPVRESKAIANRYLEVIESGMSSTEIAEDLRMLPTVRSSLPGNTPQTPVFRLPRRLEDLVRASVIRDGSAEVLALKPDAWSRTIADIKVGLERAPLPRLPVIVVLDASLRRFVRLLVSSEFSNLHVLSRQEMLYPNALERASLLIDDE